MRSPTSKFGRSELGVRSPTSTLLNRSYASRCQRRNLLDQPDERSKRADNSRPGSDRFKVSPDESRMNAQTAAGGLGLFRLRDQNEPWHIMPPTTPMPSADDAPTLTIAVRTLLAAGFQITSFQRQALHAEFSCDKRDVFGATIQYLILLIDGTFPPEALLQARSAYARQNGRTFVVVSSSGGDHVVAWHEFIDALGGPVPNWRALAPEYGSILTTAALNEVPNGMQGEAWRIFEHAVADGFEFALGRRVQRLGGGRRGLRVSDMVTQTPDGAVIVIDAKAARNAYDVGFPELRPLVEYVNNQHVRQIGANPVGAAVLVAAKFKQDSTRLAELSGDFLAEARVPATFCEAEALAVMVEALSRAPLLRNKLRWRRLLCRGGLVDGSIVMNELGRTADEKSDR